MSRAVLAFNAGSSSLKFGLYEIEQTQDLREIGRGAAELRGGPALRIETPEGKNLLDKTLPGHSLEGLLTELLHWAIDLPGFELVAAGHRIVHGGQHFGDPVVLTPEVILQIERLTPLAPLHQPRCVAPVRAVEAAMPQLLQVGCFDTAFHRTIPPLVAAFGLPRGYQAEGIKRYGFHGLSYEYIAQYLFRYVPELAQGKVIVAHLGNGASMCALQNGRSVDTTMGFSVLDGLLMGTRCGSIDPGVLLYLLQEKQLSASELQNLLYERSGLLGISEISSDVRMLSSSPDPRAGEALDLFAFRAAREVAAMTNTLGGIDALIFTAGIGQHSARIREAICSNLNWLGVRIDTEANEAHAERIGRPDSSVDILVIPTDEEFVVASHVVNTDSFSLLEGLGSGI